MGTSSLTVAHETTGEQQTVAHGNNGELQTVVHGTVSGFGNLATLYRPFHITTTAKPFKYVYISLLNMLESQAGQFGSLSPQVPVSQLVPGGGSSGPNRSPEATLYPRGQEHCSTASARCRPVFWGTATSIDTSDSLSDTGRGTSQTRPDQSDQNTPLTACQTRDHDFLSTLLLGSITVNVWW